MIKEKLLKKEILKEKIVKTISIIISIVLLTGCSNKSFSEDFIKYMKNNNYSVVDLSNKNKKMILAVGDHYQVYFYEFENYNKAKKDLDTNIKEYSNVKNKKDKNKETYIIEDENIYTIYVLKNNTYIYISATKNYKNDINNLLENIGY